MIKDIDFEVFYDYYNINEKENNKMSGTKIGGAKAAYTNKLRHGLDFYARIGAMGGRNGHTGGFAANPELARIAGQKGGLKSRRWKNKPIHSGLEPEVEEL